MASDDVRGRGGTWHGEVEVLGVWRRRSRPGDELHDLAGVGGGGSSGACVDAVVARADRDLETATARAVREAMPTWAQTFAKMHTPLKLAHVVSVDV